MNKTIQGIRAVGMLTIFLFHASILPNAQFPVTFFFMASGFGLYLSRCEKTQQELSWKNNLLWVKNKFRYFYAVHLLLFLVSLPIRWNEMKILPHPVLRAVLHLTLLQSWTPWLSYGFNSVSWYLSSLLFVYLAAFWLVRRVRACRHCGAWTAVLIGAQLLLTGVYARVGFPLGQEPYYSPLYRVLELATGMFAARYLGGSQGKKAEGTAMELLSLLLVALPYLFLARRSNGLLPGVYALGFLAVICVYGRQKGVLSRLLCLRPVQWLAGFGFEFYMVHELLIVQIRHWMGPLNWPWRVLAPVSALLALGAALAFAWACQKWLKPRFAPKKQLQTV